MSEQAMIDMVWPKHCIGRWFSYLLRNYPL